MEFFKFLKMQYLITKISILSDHKNIYTFWNFCFEKLYIDTSLLLSMTKSTLRKCCKKKKKKGFCYKRHNKNCKCINNLMWILRLQPATLFCKIYCSLKWKIKIYQSFLKNAYVSF